MTPYTNFIITPYALLSILGALASAFVTVITWPKRDNIAARPLIALTIAAFFWSGGSGLGRMSIGVEAKTGWAIIVYIGVLLTPVFLFLFALEYKTQKPWFTTRYVSTLSIIPGILWILAITNDLHRLVWRDVVLVGPPAANLANFIHGPAFYIGVIGYSYTLLIISTFLIISAALRPNRTYRRQTFLISAGALAPWTANILYILDIQPPGIDLTPIAIVISGITFSIAILRYQLLELVPLAHHTLIQTMDDGIIVLDAQNRLIEINPAACRFMGIVNPQPGQPLSQVLETIPDRQGLRAAPAAEGWARPAAEDWAAPAAEGWAGFAKDNCYALVPGRVEIEISFPETRTLEIHISEIRDRNGLVSGHLLALRDITQQKAASAALEQLNNHLEELVEQRTQALAASQERFAEVITSISDHVYALRVNPDGTLTNLYSTPHFLEMTGLPAPMPGDSVQSNTVATVHPDDLDGLLAVYAQTLETGHGEHEHRWIRTDGSILWVRSSLRLIVKNDETIIYGVNSDITERKRTEETNAEIRAFIEQDRLRLELVSSVSHELRTPLGIIKGATTTLQRPDVTFAPALRHQLLTNIITEADRLDRLVADLLDISQMAQHSIILNLLPVDLSTLVQTQVSLVQDKLDMTPATPDKQATTHNFILHHPDTPIIAHIDAARMEQVLRNLLDNAIIYSPDGGDITITLRTVSNPQPQALHNAQPQALPNLQPQALHNAQPQALAEIEITDSGIGIALEEQSHIFERFFRSDHPAVQSVRGTGLGLAISSEIVQAHHGSIEVRSTPGSGSTFIVRIPLCAGDETTPANLESPSQQ